jgi:group I intron endonuclease
MVKNLIDGKMYIGKTKYTLEHRKKEHIKSIDKRVNSLLYRAIKKYGIDNFEWSVLCECKSEDELNKMEVDYISKYNTFNSGYNMTTGGDGGYTFSDEVLKRIGENTSVRNEKFGNPFADKFHSDETKALISEKLKLYYETNNAPFKGKSHSDEAKALISEKLKSYYETNNAPFKGKSHSDDSKNIMSDKRKEWHGSNINGFKGKFHTEEVRQIISDKAKGRPSPNKDKELSETHKQNLSKSQLEWLKHNEHPNLGKTWKHSKKREYVELTCPHCGKVGKGPNMNRYHFHNCKISEKSGIW